MGETIAASGLTALVLVVTAITALWKAFIGGDIVAGKTHAGCAMTLEKEQQLNRDLVNALQRKNDLDEKLLEDRERQRREESDRARERDRERTERQGKRG